MPKFKQQHEVKPAFKKFRRRRRKKPNGKRAKAKAAQTKLEALVESLADKYFDSVPDEQREELEQGLKSELNVEEEEDWEVLAKRKPI